MSYSKTTEGDTIRLQIDAQLDSMNAPELRSVFDEIIEAHPRVVIVDLSGLRLIDSSGVGAIVSLFKRVKGYGGSFKVEGINGQPRSIFKVLRLDRVFDIQ